MRIKLKALDDFERRFIRATALAGATELLLALSKLGPLIGKHLQTFGYLGIGMILLAAYHEMFRRLERRKDGQEIH